MRAVFLLFAIALTLLGAPPTPESWFGHKIGADRELLDWVKVVSYFEALGQSSDKIRVSEFGRSADGRPMIVATISAPETLRSLDRYREIQRRLADPRTTSPEQAEPLFAQGKTVVLITCSIHATEVASTHTAVEFAYRLITEQKPRFQSILANDIVLLAPSINPDGVDIVTQWYRRTLGTPFEGTSPPELYQKYIGHDNNRDWYIMTQPETRAVVGGLQNKWHPQIVYDVHQQESAGSRMFLPPWLDPIEPNVDPILAQGMNMIGTSMASDLTSAGFKGISIHSTYDFWSPSRAYQSFHGGLRILSESASAKLATPIDVPFEKLDRQALGYDAQRSSWNFLEPWPGGRWTLRNIIDYQEAAFESCLYQAAIHRDELLRAFYKVGQNAVGPHTLAAFEVLGNQRDPGATHRLVEKLRLGQVEVTPQTDGGYLIRTSQPYSSYAKALLERQHYPDIREYPGGPPRRPYDVTAHTLPLLFGVEVREIPRIYHIANPSEPATGSHLSFKASDTDSWTAINKIWSSGGRVWRNPDSGDFADHAAQNEIEIKRPRIALYRSWKPSNDEGWTRWLFDEFGFAYQRVTNQDFERPDLNDRFDVMVFPDQSPADLETGYKNGEMPDEFTGGITDAGLKEIRQFVESGGTAIFLNRSTDYAVRHLGVGSASVSADIPNTEFYSPGSLLNVELDLRHPLTRGMPKYITIWSEQSPAWEATEDSVARYPEKEILASGWLLGENVIARKSALLDIMLGKGHVILFGMRPQYRGQSYLTFKLFFNALLYH
jgi:hypothetical protein